MMVSVVQMHEQMADRAEERSREAEEELRPLVAHGRGASASTIALITDVEYHRLGRGHVAGAVDIDHHAHQTNKVAQVGAFSQRETVGCAHKSRPVSGSRPQASLSAGSNRSRSRSSASS